ncbi:MAG: hypothetical protein HQK84_10895 [Nitrospinae bacterium]|nr:hypothetical protein [Nitrospinota bacterium]
MTEDKKEKEENKEEKTKEDKKVENSKVEEKPVSTKTAPQEKESIRLTEILLLLMIVLLAATSLYFYQSKEQLSEELNSLNSNNAKNTTTISNLEQQFGKILNELEVLKSDKNVTKEALLNIQKKVENISNINDIFKERLNDVTGSQRDNFMEINKIISHITNQERDKNVTELKKALLILSSVGKDGAGKSKVIAEKLEKEINDLINEFTQESRTNLKKNMSDAPKQEKQETGVVGKIELQEDKENKGDEN